MVDLDVYRLAGSVLLAGGDFYTLPGQLQFLYPPFAALLAVPLAVLPPTLVQVAWTAAGALALVAVLYRFGLTGWVLSLVATAAVLLPSPSSRRWRSDSWGSSSSRWSSSTWRPDLGCCPAGCCRRAH